LNRWEGIVEGEGGELVFSFHNRERHLPASVIWLNKTELHEKPIGFGVRFVLNEKKVVGRIVQQIKKDL